MKGHGAKFGRKQEEAIAALLTQRNIDEAAKAVGIATNTLRILPGVSSLNWTVQLRCGFGFAMLVK
jgi:hypothetical protein